MRAGDWEAAWRETDAMEADRRAGRVPRDEHHLFWDGTPPDGRTVLVRCEHGLGDTLQFMRFLPRLGARQLHFLVQPPLVALLRGAPGLGEVRNYWTEDPLPPHEVDLEVMELAYALRVTPATLPAPYPHLAAQLPAAHGLALPEDGLLRVGLFWTTSHWDPSRSVPLRLLEPLFALPQVRFYSLQQGPDADDPLQDAFDLVRLSPRTAGIEQAAAALCRLDLVISVDAMPVHLAGTLGRPTWVLLKHQADWRWMEGRADSPWYPSVRLFRQQREGDWEAVVQRVAEELARMCPHLQAAGERSRRLVVSDANPS
jgi:hypothetical protein